MTLAAALAKRFWKLTGLSDGVWEEGKISPSAPAACLCSGFVFCFSVVGHEICPASSEMGMDSWAHSVRVPPPPLTPPLHPWRWGL